MKIIDDWCLTVILGRYWQDMFFKPRCEIDLDTFWFSTRVLAIIITSTQYGEVEYICQLINQIKRKIMYRKLKSIDIEQFRNDIKRLPLYNNYSDMTLLEWSEAYDTQLSNLLDTHAPVISRTTSVARRDPWINQEVLDANREKGKLNDSSENIETMKIINIFVKSAILFDHYCRIQKPNISIRN